MDRASEPTAWPAAGLADLIGHAARAHRAPAFALPAVTLAGRRRQVREKRILCRPFWVLRGFDLDGRGEGPIVLAVAPLSGHFCVILRDLVAALLPEHRVCVTDWRDAAAVPAADGGFDLNDAIGAVIEALHALGPGAHAIGMSQSAAPLLAAAALMAAARDADRPRSVTLMGGLIDTRINPTPSNRLARTLFGSPRLAAWCERTLVAPVPTGWPGAGRMVHPAALQLAGLGLYLLRRMGPDRPTPQAAFHGALVRDGQAAARHRRLYDDFLTLMDLPAELYLQTMRALFVDDALATGRLTWRNRRVEPAAIRDIALMTVEAEHDDISGPGQTRAAHALCPDIPDRLRRHHVEPEAGHLGMFHGRRWRRHVLPRLRAFIREVA